MLKTPFAALSNLTSPPLKGVGRAFGTCGELVQGQFDSGEDFLITLPVDLWSEARVTIDVNSSGVRSGINPCLSPWKSAEADSSSSPKGFHELSSGLKPRETVPEKTKTSLAIRKALDCLGFPAWGATFQVRSDLPEGKGMASSSADIVAACRAVSAALNLPLPAEEISRIAVSIEPTDGVMYAGVVCYNHRTGNLLESLGEMPPANLLILDLGTQVDTFAFNQIPKNYTAAERKKIQRAYQLVRDGIQMRDIAQVGLGATLSAEVNQRLLPKPHFETLLRMAREYDASGVCAAHSGTVLGLLFAPRLSHRIAAARRAILDIDRSIRSIETKTL
ncbi:MAG: GHMP kinase [Chloroflexi bacterium]|nr:GHMP kinase [Chloroflexota bacterium]